MNKIKQTSLEKAIQKQVDDRFKKAEVEIGETSIKNLDIHLDFKRILTKIKRLEEEIENLEDKIRANNEEDAKVERKI